MILLTAAILLSFERIAYILVWRRPEAFRALCERVGLGPPVLALRRLFYLFKAIQGVVFLGWCCYFGASSYSLIDLRPIPFAVGAMLYFSKSLRRTVSRESSS